MSRLIKYEKTLKEIFGYDKLKDKQYNIIDKLIHDKENVCGIMKTGYGKSLCYQFPPLYLNKIAIIISPLISLMEDQKLQLNKMNISVCCLNSTEDTSSNTIKDIVDNKFRIIFMTPEYAINAQYLFTKIIDNLCLIAIDEAHCISLWGNSFRESYIKLYIIKEWIKNIPILILTATATNRVLNDIQNILKIDNINIIKDNFDRPNLYLDIQYKFDKTETILKSILIKNKKFIDEYVIIYCLTKKETDKTAEIVQKLGINCEAYHSDIDSDKKKDIQNEFINGNNLKCIVATIAFGMGINKSNIRKIIHMNLPKNIESYYQEIGRAGRDGLSSQCYAFYTSKDIELHKFMIENNVDNKDNKKIKYEMLDEMYNFAKSYNCKRKELLRYFEEDYKGECKNCSRCLININEQKDYTNEAVMFFELIKDINCEYGLSTIILILRGSKSKKINYFFKNKFYGKGKEYSEIFWKKIGRYLINQKYLEEINVDAFYNKINYTKLGINWLKSIYNNNNNNKVFIN